MELGYFGGLVAFLCGWFFAQLGKTIGDIIKKKRPLRFGELVDSFTRSGGMPSGHTASFVALTMFFGLKDGFMSGLFVLSAAMAVIVIYDAVNVRYAVGEQGKMLNIIVDDHKYKKKTKVVEGHTVPQTIVGGIIGIVVGLICGIVF